MIAKILLAMLAFAANSVLCRVALKGGHIDPISLSNLRLFCGAVVLYLLLLTPRFKRKAEWHWRSALCLLIYVFAFSLAYLQLEAGTGALLLFGSVQLTMMLWGRMKGEHIHPLKGVGIVVALAGIAVLLLPGASTPPFIPALLMMLSGLAWGAYSIVGKSARDAVAATAGNFILTLPVLAVVALCNVNHASSDSSGIVLALVSGGLTSGGAYVLWYSLLPRLSAATASTLQLSVPCLASLGGVIFLHEIPTLALGIATLAVLTGIALAIISDNRSR